MNFELFIGYDPRLQLAWRVCQRSAVAKTKVPPAIRPIGISTLGSLYGRPTKRVGDRLIDGISNAPMATEFALARFFVPLLAKAQWAIFCDGDFMFREDIGQLIDEVDPRHAVSVVKHAHQPIEHDKMDGQVQLDYPRKNWSSLMVWNLAHAGSRRLTGIDANSQTGLWLHGLSWLKDEEIGALDPAWNWLEGSGDKAIDPLAVHFTRGTPDMDGYAEASFAAEWRQYLTLEEAAQCDLETCATA